MREGAGTPLTRDILFVYEDGTWPHRNYIGSVERAERTPSIERADRDARGDSFGDFHGIRGRPVRVANTI